jgi:hypothetical protein
LGRKKQANRRVPAEMQIRIGSKKLNPIRPRIRPDREMASLSLAAKAEKERSLKGQMKAKRDGNARASKFGRETGKSDQRLANRNK